MRLKEYLTKTGIPMTRLADRCGLSFHQVYRVVIGGEPKLRNAMRISRYTQLNPYLHKDGVTKEYVQPFDMVPLDEMVKIEQEIDKHD